MQGIKDNTSIWRDGPLLLWTPWEPHNPTLAVWSLYWMPLSKLADPPLSQWKVLFHGNKDHPVATLEQPSQRGYLSLVAQHLSLPALIHSHTSLLTILDTGTCENKQLSQHQTKQVWNRLLIDEDGKILLEWTTVACTNVSMTVAMHLDLTWSIVAFKDFKVFTGLWLHIPTTWVGGWPGRWLFWNWK